MTALNHAMATMHGTTRPAFAARFVSGVVNFLRAIKNRRQFYRLGEMSDAELADIGLVRTDLFVALQSPFGTDPTVKLGALAEERISMIENMARRVS